MSSFKKYLAGPLALVVLLMAALTAVAEVQAHDEASTEGQGAVIEIVVTDRDLAIEELMNPGVAGFSSVPFSFYAADTSGISIGDVDLVIEELMRAPYRVSITDYLVVEELMDPFGTVGLSNVPLGFYAPSSSGVSIGDLDLVLEELMRAAW